MDLESGVNPPNRFSFYEYFKRGFNYKQMDIENSLQQMMDLCINPKKVYATSKFHKRMIPSVLLRVLTCRNEAAVGSR
jgi:hypothetical protein